MRFSTIAFHIAVAAPLLTLTAPAQRHGRSSPPTGPPAAAKPQPAPVTPSIPYGLGAIQFVAVNYGVPAPQALTRQLRFDDDRTRAAALSAIGAPGQYLQHGHIPMPRAIDLQLIPMGSTDELDALLTVELDQHIVTAVLIPDEGNWRRVATLIFPTPYYDPATTPSTWVRTARTLVQPDRYRAIFHASSGSMSGNFAENEAHVRIINNKAVIVLSFESTSRACAAPPPQPPAKGAKPTPAPVNASSIKSGCDVTQRWFQSDPVEPTKHFELITATGHISPKEVAEPFGNARTVLLSHLRNFSCQPFLYSEAAQKYEPLAPSTTCRAR